MWIRERIDIQSSIEGVFPRHLRPRVVDDVNDKGGKVFSLGNLRIICRFCAKKIGEITEDGTVTRLPEADSVCSDPFPIDF